MRVGLIGAGNMARALARGLGRAGASAPTAARAARGRWSTELGGEAVATNLEVAERADLVVLAHKPYQLEDVAREIRGHVKAIASVLGGTTLGRAAGRLSRTRPCTC